LGMYTGWETKTVYRIFGGDTVNLQNTEFFAAIIQLN
jgi:hypothetical protein